MEAGCVPLGGEKTSITLLKRKALQSPTGCLPPLCLHAGVTGPGGGGGGGFAIFELL